jgi:hypothetical protein
VATVSGCEIVLQLMVQAAQLRQKMFSLCIGIGILSLIIWTADPIFIYGSRGQWIWDIVSFIPFGWGPDIPQDIVLVSAGIIPHFIITGAAFLVAAIIGKNKKPATLVDSREFAFLSAVILFTAAMVGFAELCAFEQYYAPMWQDLIFLASESNYGLLVLNIVACFLPKFVPILLLAYAGTISLKVLELKTNAP